MVTRAQLFLDRFEGEILVVTNCSPHDIALGTTLRYLYANDVCWVGDNFISTLALGPEPVKISILSSKIFRTNIECVPRGWSAGIEVSGEGVDLVRTMLNKRRPKLQIFLDTHFPISGDAV